MNPENRNGILLLAGWLIGSVQKPDIRKEIKACFPNMNIAEVSAGILNLVVEGVIRYDAAFPTEDGR